MKKLLIFFTLISSCATATPGPQEPWLCKEFYIDFNTDKPYPTIGAGILNAMEQLCFQDHHRCLQSVTQISQNDWDYECGE